jgi:hypothetical protein
LLAEALAAVLVVAGLVAFFHLPSISLPGRTQSRLAQVERL